LISAHEEVLPLLPLLAFGNVRNDADDARGRALTPGALEIGKPMYLDPADVAAPR
jgi:hypothetical protein